MSQTNDDKQSKTIDLNSEALASLSAEIVAIRNALQEQNTEHSKVGHQMCKSLKDVKLKNEKEIKSMCCQMKNIESQLNKVHSERLNGFGCLESKVSQLQSKIDSQDSTIKTLMSDNEKLMKFKMIILRVFHLQ